MNIHKFILNKACCAVCPPKAQKCRARPIGHPKIVAIDSSEKLKDCMYKKMMGK
ncbi:MULTISPECIES: hypothetical protein [Campylobacter]|uniref:hypothetical protein n=1 Tax=Campylobacter TaxID=194 RepID=UPI0001593B93|nr:MULTISPECIES: hypothetical protein [Campylobacter]EJP75214.1 hypothetical protein HMPREF1139_1437 [Campylobacter sp. FOBRC14]